MRPWLGRLLALAIGVTTGIAILEAGIRALGLDRPALQLALVGSKSPTSAYHPRLGWVNLPDSSGWLSWPDNPRSFHLDTNHQGFRFPRDYTRKKNRRYRIALVGDSQVFGFVVEDDEHLGVLLDRRLQDVETYSFGVPGYGPTQETLLLEDTVLDYAPDVVVAVLFLHNDLNDETERLAYGFLPKPYLRQGGNGAWQVANVPVPLPLQTSDTGTRSFFHLASTPFALSAIYRLAVYRSATTPALASALVELGLGTLEVVPVRPGTGQQADAGFRRIDGREPACNVVSNCPASQWLDGLPAALAAYERMARDCQARGVTFVALVAPAETEFFWKAFPITTAVTDAFREKGIDMLSLEAPFTRSGDAMRLIARDQHWNAEGTRVAADVVAEWVETLLARPPDAAGAPR